MCIDSAAVHEFTFTPALSLHVQLADEHDVDRLFAALAQDGQVLMPLAAYPFARRYGWCSDRYGVAWQLSHGAVDLR